MPNHCLQILLLLFNRIWFTGEIPPEWLHSMIVPLHKPNKPVNLPHSYRPISLTSHICKLMERMVAVRFRWYLEKNNILNKYQSGFRERRRPIDHLLNLHDTVYKALANQRSVLAVFIDIKKAFDMVHKDTLLLKLLKIGIQGFMFNFLRSFLSNRTFHVKVSSTPSQIKTLQNGVPQGSGLSPLLFAIMINDLPSCFNSSAALFADDLCFWEVGTDIQHLNDLTQASLNNVEAWCETNGFKISVNKSAALLFTKKRKNKNVSLMLYNQTLELKKQVKYLGIIFQDNGIYSAHARYVQEKCLKRINVLRMLKGSNWGMSQDALLSLYRALIRPIIEYGMEIYFNCSDSTLKIIETLQHECLRICTGALRSTPIDCLQHYCNEMPLKIKFQQLCLYYRAHLSTFTDHPTAAITIDSWQERWPDDHTNFCSFNMQTRTFFENTNITAHKHFVSDVPPWFINKPIVNYDFLLHCGKNDNPSIINASFLEIIYTNYCNVTLLYTDGSKGQLGTSSALFVPTSNTKKSIAINSSSSIFTAELYGILTALQWIAINRQQKSLIITDSCSVLQAIQSKTFGKHYILSRVLLLYHRLTLSGLIIHFLWVPSHCGIIGNETADYLTKSVFRSNDESFKSDVQIIELETKLTYSEVKSIIRHHCLEKWNQKYIQPTTGSQYKSLFPDVQSKNPKHHNNQIFRLQTGHCRLNYHLHRIAKHQTGLCQVCNVPESVSHFLFHCPHYFHFRSVMKNYVDNMGLKFDLHNILTNKCTFDCVCDFVKSCKKFI